MVALFLPSTHFVFKFCWLEALNELQCLQFGVLGGKLLQVVFFSDSLCMTCDG